MKKTISVMIPCYNEAENAHPIYEAVKNELQKSCPAYDYEILFIDNKSTDGTREILRQICAEDRHVKAIFNVKNFGQFNSPYYGLLQTSGDCTICMCADFQDPVELIPEFVHWWEKGYKIVIGRKTKSQDKTKLSPGIPPIINQKEDDPADIACDRRSCGSFQACAKPFH